MMILFAPKYTPASAGIVALYRLYETLLEIAEDVTLVTYRGIGSQYEISLDRLNWLDPMYLVDLHSSIDFIIVPEVISADLLPENINIVRYYLNSSGAIVRGVKFRRSEYRIGFEPMFVDEPHQILHQYLGKIAITDAASPNELPKFINATYYGKLEGKYSSDGPLPSSILITRSWPQDQEQYLRILASAEYFFSFDSCSSANVDAIVSGAILVILDFDCFSEEKLSQSLFPLPYLTAQNYADPAAIQKYFDERKVWISSLQENSGKFKKQVSTVISDAKQFFGLTCKEMSDKISSN